MDKPKRAIKEFAHVRGHPPRVAPRLEAVVKNRGIKPVRKPKKVHEHSH